MDIIDGGAEAYLLGLGWTIQHMRKEKSSVTLALPNDREIVRRMTLVDAYRLYRDSAGEIVKIIAIKAKLELKIYFLLFINYIKILIILK